MRTVSEHERDFSAFASDLQERFVQDVGKHICRRLDTAQPDKRHELDMPRMWGKVRRTLNRVQVPGRMPDGLAAGLGAFLVGSALSES
jgi:hypothetical protein